MTPTIITFCLLWLTMAAVSIIATFRYLRCPKFISISSMWFRDFSDRAVHRLMLVSAFFLAMLSIEGFLRAIQYTAALKTRSDILASWTAFTIPLALIIAAPALAILFHKIISTITQGRSKTHRRIGAVLFSYLALASASLPGSLLILAAI